MHHGDRGMGLVKSRIGRRLVCMLLAGVLLTYGILAYLIYVREREIVYAIKKDKAVHDAGELIKVIEESMLKEHKFSYIKTLIDNHNNSSDMWITLYRNDGSVYYGPTLRESPPGRIFFSPERVIIKGDKGFHVFQPIMNEEACRGCHGATEQVRGAVAAFISTAEIEAALEAIYGKMALALLATALLSIAGVLLTTRWMILTPLGVLTEAARAVWKGDFRHRIRIRRRDEFGGFADTFNVMAEKIENSHKDLEAAVLKRTKDLKAIAKLSTEVFRGDLNFEEKIDLFLDAITGELGYDFCTLCLIEKETGSLTQEYRRGLSGPLCSSEVRIDTDHPVLLAMLGAKTVVLEAEKAGLPHIKGQMAMLPIISYRRKRCKSVQNCRDEYCPAYGYSDEKCWLIDCVPCKLRFGKKGREKLVDCVNCPAFPLMGVLIAGREGISPSSLYPVEVLASEIAAFIDNHQLIDRQNRDIKELIRLHGTSLKAIELLNSAQVYENIVQASVSFASASASALWLLEDGKLVLKGSFGMEAALPPRTLSMTGEFPGVAIAAAAILEAGGGAEAGPLAELMEKNGFRHAASVPLKGKEWVQGCLTLFREKEFGMDDSTRAVLMLYGSQAASNLEMTRLYEELREQRELLRESEQKYRRLIESSNDAILITEGEGGPIININRKAQEMLSLHPKEILGRRIMQFHPGGEEDFYRTVYFEALAGRSVSGGVYICGGGGTSRPVEISASAVDLGDKRLVQIVFRDITERKKAEDALRESEASYRTLSENLPGIVYRLYLEEKRMVFFNDMLEQMTGYRSDELVKGEICRIDEHILREDRGRVFDSIRRAIMEDTPFDVEYRFRHKDGGIRHFHERGRPVRVGEGFSHIDGVIFDITESKRAEEGLRESEEKFRSLAETTSSGIFICTRSIIYANPAIEKISGYSGAELTGRMFGELIHPAFKEAYEKLNAACMEISLEEPLRKEFKIITKEGAERWLELTAKSINYRGAPALLGTVFDITDRKLMEEALRELAQGSVSSVTGEEALRSIVVYLAQALAFDFAMVGELEDAENQSVQTVAFYGKGQMLENMQYRLVGTPCENVAGKTLCSYAKDVRKLFPDDPYLSVFGIESYIGTPLFDSRGRPLGILVMMDTKPMATSKTAESMLRIFAVRAAAELERRRREEELKSLISILRAEKEFSEAIFNSTASGVIVMDEEGVILRLNQPGAEILELPPGEARGKHITEIHPALREFILDDKRLNKELEITFADGRIKPIGYVNSPLVAQYGEERGIIVVFRDLTEIKKLHAEIRKKQHFESMGKVISGVAHEIRNPLFAVQSIGQILQRDAATPQNQGLIEAMLKETTRMKNLIEELLLYSRPSKLEFSEVDLDIFLEEIKNYMAMKGTGCSIRVEVPPLLALRVDRDKLKQVFLNLIDNSAGAGATDVEIAVSKKQDGGVRIIVRDNGRGIEPADIERIFDPFFTTKKEGTGLGLPICRKIVEEHGGMLEVKSEKERGTMVSILLVS